MTTPVPANATLNPTGEQLGAFANGPDDGPIVMVNLLRYLDQASDGSGRTGREAYATYGAAVIPMVIERGGSFEFMASAHATVIGPADEQWDEVILVQYPSRAAFLDMISSDAYQVAMVDREVALADSRLIPTTRTDR
ncbi:unannotated protein [freshwater metagenome]|uniref:Unannotated protein n=1 Tax=freshwater metagenome TaxID=449393 RepID=A0A6J6IDZ5_9ZZZZ